MSEALDLLGIAKALAEATRHLGAPWDSWQAAEGAARDSQLELLRRLCALERDAERIPEIRAWVRRTAEEINEILAAEGFNIRLSPWPDDGSFGVLSIFELLVEWLDVGDKVSVKAREGERSFPGFRLDCDRHGPEFYDAGFAEPVVVLPTRSEDRVCLHVTTEAAKGFALYERVAELKKGRVRRIHFDDVSIPQVKLRLEPDISWLQDLALPEAIAPPGFSIGQARQEVRFGMNERGAKAKTANLMAALAMGIPSPPKHYIVDAPFLLWIERPKIETPLFVAYVTEDDWQAVESLDQI